jgi:hypothetical protein
MKRAPGSQEVLNMTDARFEYVSGASACRAATVTLAALLLFVGIVFQLGEFGHGGFAVGNLWLFSMIAQNLWDLLAVHYNMPVLGELLRLWPLLLVAAGLALLAVPSSSPCPVGASVSEARVAKRE